MRRLLVLTFLAVAAATTAVQAQTPVVVEYYHTDALGSVRAVTNAQGQIVRRHDFMPFGEGFNQPIPPGERHLYTGKERDHETGLDYFGARYYRAGVGRFTTIDPVYAWKDNLVDPQRWNRYAYVTNNPLKYTDPDGRDRMGMYQHGVASPHPFGPAPWAGLRREMGTQLALAGLVVGPLMGAPVLEAGIFGAVSSPAAALVGLRMLQRVGMTPDARISVPGPVNSLYGKVDYLLGMVPRSVDSIGKGGFFRGVLGFAPDTLGAALKSHLADNLGSAIVSSGRVIVTAPMIGPNGTTAIVRSVWQWVNGQFALITAMPAK